MNDSLGDRMKGYENAYRIVLPRRMPVIMRLDGKAFHTLTRDAERPFDEVLGNAMLGVAVRLCEEVHGAQIAFCQSDEISILIHNYKTLETEPWFGNGLQKMVSIAASTAASRFDWRSRKAAFDCRAWVLPEAEVCNYFIWRQQDATRNSIQMLARSLYSHNECEHKNSSELQELCWQKGHNWNNLPARWKRGTCIVREGFEVDGVQRHRWVPDFSTPVFTKSREYIERLLEVESD